MHSNLEYRADIDGLRALAVLMVVFSHAQIESLSGGFVGVDVFFVISGFLVSSILLEETIQGNFSIPAFFARRIRRILPALSVVILCTLVAGFYLLPPNELSQLAKATLSVATLSSNHFFLGSQNDYWDQQTLGDQPLLHTWSIAIEEQFYLTLPILLSALIFIGRRMHGRSRQALIGLSPVFMVLAVLSFSFCALAVQKNPALGFYAFPARAWELLIGAMLAVYLSQPRKANRITQETLGLAGLMMILWCCFRYDQGTQFPSWSALLPCVGTALIIFSGSFGAKTLLGRFLSLKPIVFIGLISFSIYLWHLPVLVLSRSPYWLYWEISPNQLAIQLSITAILSVLTWKYVELPFRASKIYAPRPTILAGALCLVSIFGFGTLSEQISLGNGPIAQRVPASLKSLLPSKEDAPFREWEFSGTPAQILETGGVVVGAPRMAPSFIVLGDSFASMWGPSLDQAAKIHEISGLLLARALCAALDGLARTNNENCQEAIEARLQFAERSQIKNVVLAVAWSSVVKEHSAQYYLKGDHSEPAIRRIALENTLARLSTGGKKIFVVLETPGGEDSPYSAAIRSLRSQQKVAYSQRGKKESDQHNSSLEFLRDLTALQKKYPFTILDPTALLCNLEGCLVAKNGKPVYHDNIHLSVFGSDLLGRIFEPLWTTAR